MIKILFLALLASLTSAQLSAQTSGSSDTKKPDVVPSISIILDDIGEQLSPALRVIAMPYQLTYAFIPHTTHARYLAELAHKSNKEVMLHMPMQSLNQERLGEGGLTFDMTRERFTQMVRKNLKAIPHIKGVNNHMGSQLTQNVSNMQWLMDEIKTKRSMYFVDSRTTAASVGLKTAQNNGIPSLKRDVFLDTDISTEAINYQFQRLIKKARKNGSAVAIGHLYPLTLAVLAKELPKLAAAGIKLVPVSKLIQYNDYLASLKPIKLVSNNADHPHNGNTETIIPQPKIQHF